MADGELVSDALLTETDKPLEPSSSLSSVKPVSADNLESSENIDPVKTAASDPESIGKSDNSNDQNMASSNDQSKPSDTEFKNGLSELRSSSLPEENSDSDSSTTRAATEASEPVKTNGDAAEKLTSSPLKSSETVDSVEKPTSSPPKMSNDNQSGEAHHSSNRSTTESSVQQSSNGKTSVDSKPMNKSTKEIDQVDDDDDEIECLDDDDVTKSSPLNCETVISKFSEFVQKLHSEALTNPQSLVSEVGDQKVTDLINATLAKEKSNGREKELKSLLKDESSDFAYPLSISVPPSMVVNLLAEYRGVQSIGEFRETNLKNVPAPELSNFERRSKQEFRMHYPAPAMTKIINDLGLQLVQERTYSDLIAMRNLPTDIPQKAEQAKKVADQIKPHLISLQKEIAHLKSETKVCPRCDFETDSQHAMHRHQQYLHFDHGRNQCGMCKLTTLDVNELKEHYVSRHGCPMIYEPPIQKYPCPCCHQEFQFKGVLMQHLKECKRSMRYNILLRPSESDASAVNRWLWNRPKSIHPSGISTGVSVQSTNPQGLYQAYLNAQQAQQQGFAQRYGVQQQIMLQPNGNRMKQQMQGNSCVCELCDQLMDNRIALLTHFKSTHKKYMGKSPIDMAGGVPLACSRCKDRFWTYEGLERHLLMSHGLVAADLLAKAQRKEDQGRCKYCGKQYAFNLLQHLVVDHKKKLCSAEIVYSCDNCSYSCISYTQLEKHLVDKHGGNNTMVGTKRPGNLQANYNAKNPRMSQPSSSNQSEKAKGPKLRYTCTPCALKFSQYSQVIEHWGEKHLRKFEIHSCRIDSCEKCRLEKFGGIKVDLTPPASSSKNYPEDRVPSKASSAVKSNFASSQVIELE